MTDDLKPAHVGGVEASEDEHADALSGEPGKWFEYLRRQEKLGRPVLISQAFLQAANETAREMGELDDLMDTPVDGTDEQAQEYRRTFIKRAVVPTGWQDIASAPKDRTTVLGYTPYASVVIGDVFYNPELEQWERLPSDCVKPTHWMPLPPSPLAGSK